MHESAYHIAVGYEWDGVKSEANAKKHRIRFADAAGVFEDEAALSREDLGSEGERRYIATGMDFLGRILTVVYTCRPDAIRLISARRASNREREAYEGRRH